MKKLLYLVTSILVTSCCFSCGKKKKEEPKKTTITAIVQNLLTNEHTIKFLYKGKNDFVVNWGDGSPEDSNTSHTYSSQIEATITITGTFDSIQFATDEGSFNDNNLIRSITIDGADISLPSYAFNYCEGLKSVVIGENVTSIGANAFDNCPSAVFYCKTKSKPKSWDNTWKPNGRQCYWGFESKGNENEFRYVATQSDVFITSYSGDDIVINIPNQIKDRDVTVIDSNAFDNEAIVIIKMPATLKAIKNNAFVGCTNLASIDLTSFTDWFGDIPTAENNAFNSPFVNFKVASKNMSYAFMARKGGWPSNPYRYVFEDD